MFFGYNQLSIRHGFPFDLDSRVSHGRVLVILMNNFVEFFKIAQYKKYKPAEEKKSMTCNLGLKCLRGSLSAIYIYTVRRKKG
jgi:hypothetical protein